MHDSAVMREGMCHEVAMFNIYSTLRWADLFQIWSNEKKARAMYTCQVWYCRLTCSCILPIQVCDSDLSLFVNSIVIERQVNFYYSKKYAQHFLSQPLFIILTFSRLKHQNYVSSTTRVSESTRCKVVALVSARSAAVAELKTASVPPALAKRVGQINNFYWSFLTVRLLTKSRVYILAIK